MRPSCPKISTLHVLATQLMHYAGYVPGWTGKKRQRSGFLLVLIRGRALWIYPGPSLLSSVTSGACTWGIAHQVSDSAPPGETPEVHGLMPAMLLIGFLLRRNARLEALECFNVNHNCAIIGVAKKPGRYIFGHS